MTRHTIYVCSDAVGETAEAVARATLRQFASEHVNIKRYGHIRTEEEIVRIVHEAAKSGGFKLADVKMMTISRELAETHYGHLKTKPFFEELVDFIMSGPVFAMILEGTNAVANARSVIGATNPVEAVPGSIRGDFGMDVASNIVHGSDSDDNAEREIRLFFG